MQTKHNIYALLAQLLMREGRVGEGEGRRERENVLDHRLHVVMHNIMVCWYPYDMYTVDRYGLVLWTYIMYDHMT